MTETEQKETKKAKFPGIKNLLENCLALKPTDRVFVAYDSEHKTVAYHIYDQLTRLFPNNIPAWREAEYDGESVPYEVAELLLDNEHNVGILLFSKSIYHNPERRKAKYELGKRIVTFSGTGDMLKTGPCLTDPKNIKMLCDDLATHLENAKGKPLVLKSNAGTYLEAVVSGVFYEDGLYGKKGTGGNFPAGEISFGIEEETCRGMMYFDIKIKNFGVLAKPLGFSINRGKITGAVDTNTSDSDFWHYISQSEKLLFVAEVGAGINPEYEIFGYPYSIPEEKLLATAHVGLGSNISFGGNRHGKHLDGVMSKASLSIDRLTILSNGQLNSSLLSEKTLDWLRDYNCLFAGGN